MKEVVTLQFGTYANFVGAHFWNFQDEVLGRAEAAPDSNAHEAKSPGGDESWPNDLNSDVLFRVGETHQVSGMSLDASMADSASAARDLDTRSPQIQKFPAFFRFFSDVATSLGLNTSGSSIFCKRITHPGNMVPNVRSSRKYLWLNFKGLERL